MVSPRGGTADWRQGERILVSFGVAFSFEMLGLIMGLTGGVCFVWLFFGVFFNY